MSSVQKHFTMNQVVTLTASGLSSAPPNRNVAAVRQAAANKVLGAFEIAKQAGVNRSKVTKVQYGNASGKIFGGSQVTNTLD